MWTVCRDVTSHQQANTALEDVLFYGNPIYEGLDKAEAKLQVLKRIPFVRSRCQSPGCLWHCNRPVRGRVPF